MPHVIISPSHTVESSKTGMCFSILLTKVNSYLDPRGEDVFGQYNKSVLHVRSLTTHVGHCRAYAIWTMIMIMIS